jgi:CBS domain-containing protein
MNSSVKDVMTRNVVAVRETAGYKDIVTVMRRRRVSAFPVLDAAGRVSGVVSEADLLLKEVGAEPFSGPVRSVLATGRRGERAKAAGVTAAELMSKPAVTISPEASVAEAARLMYARRLKRLPVVDEAGRLVGIVSRVDLLSVYSRPDDQIRDEVAKNVIAGEFALDPRDFDVKVASGIVTVTGHVERHSVAAHLIETIQHVEGVVDVRDRVGYPPEDAPKIAGIL